MDSPPSVYNDPVEAEDLLDVDPNYELYTQHLQTSPPVVHTSLKPKSSFYPTQSKGPYLEAFYRVVFADFQILCQKPAKKRSKHNLTPGELLSLKQFLNNPELVIKQADKDGGIVILDKSTYVAEAMRLLSDSKTYKKLSCDPLPSFRTEADLLITHAINDHVLDKKEAAFIRKDFYSTPYFYHLPKLHKDAKNPPGRPIVASMNSITSGFSLYIDSFLQPLAQALQSYIRDSTHLMGLLSPYKWTKNYSWLSLDVNSLYTSIPHEVGLLAVQNFLLTDPMLNTRQAAFILEATSFCLTHNYFHFEDQFYLQTHGTAMGANFARLMPI